MFPTTAELRESVSRSLRLSTLVTLRWLALAGQAAAILIVRYGLEFHLPLAGCFALIGISAALNLLLRFRFDPTHRLDGPYVTGLLAYDVLQLSGLLFLTGGLANPFALLLLAPVMVAAATMPPRSTMLLGAMVAGMSTLLGVFHWPLPWGPSEPPVLPPLYLAGIWMALVSTVVFSGTYAFRVAEEARQLAEALSATELVLQREKHLTALDGLAAAAAHELGTPLGTIAVVTRELEREIPQGSPIADDIALLRSQSERCREILQKLRTLATGMDAYYKRMALSSLIEEVVSPLREFGVEIAVTRIARAGVEPVGRRDPAILYGLGNIVENAVDFAKSRVEITAEWDQRQVALTIADDGPGFAPEIIDRIGEPYVTTREKSAAERDSDEVGGGLGLGFFIAKTLLKRSGARVACGNRKSPETGAVIRITWPRESLEAKPGDDDEDDGDDALLA
ncbi:two-component sensor histidine kinase [Prosthecomicrobium hirschii]|uniref:ActS/PrrB/RegB family redox-sensitive histidine kinase n=1 Tax=Prosthecodimorpha hirschii TaxID=665126 RepID=UPI00112E7BCB|nr:ActS/PrrB/RegB family redox-sensitive histidine kinase [Prosthecomicrobium hirschii]TPQ48731.1 two-component sensor histidine kinase [Prosthecomicrobium hirschii]